MWCSVMPNLIYVILFSDLISINESKTIKQYKRKNEDLLNNLNNTFATLMNIMMVDPNENAQLSKEISKEFSKEHFYKGESIQSNDYQDLLVNNSVFNQQLANIDDGYNNNRISGRSSYEKSPSFSNYFSQQTTKNNMVNDYGNPIVQNQNSYINQEQSNNGANYMEGNNPTINQIEINPSENIPSSNLIVEDNFNQISSTNLVENSPSKSSQNYLSNYSDMSKYGKIKISDFGNDEHTIGKNKNIYEFINDENTLPLNEYKKKLITVSSNSVPLKYSDDKKNSYTSYRSFSQDFDSDLDQFRITSSSPKLETTTNYFDKVNTKDPITLSKTTNTNFETQPNFGNKNLNNPSNSLSNSFQSNYNNLPGNQLSAEQRVIPNSMGTSISTNKLINHNLGYMVSNNNEQQYSSGITNSHLQLPLVIPYNQNSPVEISSQASAQKAGYSSFSNYGLGGSYAPLTSHIESTYGNHGGGGYSGSGYSSYGNNYGSGYGSNYGGGYSSYGGSHHSGGHGSGYSSYGSHSGGISIPLSYSMPIHSGYDHMPMTYNVKANVNAKITPTSVTGNHAILSYASPHGGSYGGYGTSNYNSHGSYGSYKSLPQSTTSSIKHVVKK